MNSSNLMDTSVSTATTDQDATRLVQEGKLEEAICCQRHRVERNPENNEDRLLLFELLAASGNFTGASHQIEQINYPDPQLVDQLHAYRNLLTAETMRHEVFAGNAWPHFFQAPPQYVMLQVQAVEELVQGRNDAARDLIDQANDRQPPISGRLDGQPFENLRDSDDLLQTVVEVFSAAGHYFWLPLEQVETLHLNEAPHLRDRLWNACTVQLRSGSSGTVFMPSLYSHTWDQEDPELKLGRRTDWEKQENGVSAVGFGGKVFQVDDQTVPLIQCHDLLIDE